MKFDEMETWLQKAFKDSSYGDSGKVVQVGRITWDLPGQVLGDFLVDVSSRKVRATATPFICTPQNKELFHALR